jgi:hypothetical protein
VDPVAVEALRSYFDAFWNQALTAFRAAAEAPADAQEGDRLGRSQ